MSKIDMRRKRGAVKKSREQILNGYIAELQTELEELHKSLAVKNKIIATLREDNSNILSDTKKKEFKGRVPVDETYPEFIAYFLLYFNTTTEELTLYQRQLLVYILYDSYNVRHVMITEIVGTKTVSDTIKIMRSRIEGEASRQLGLDYSNLQKWINENRN